MDGACPCPQSHLPSPFFTCPSSLHHQFVKILGALAAALVVPGLLFDKDGPPLMVYFTKVDEGALVGSGGADDDGSDMSPASRAAWAHFHASVDKSTVAAGGDPRLGVQLGALRRAEAEASETQSAASHRVQRED